MGGFGWAALVSEEREGLAPDAGGVVLVAQGGIGDGKAGECVGFAVTMAEVAPEGERPGVATDGMGVVTDVQRDVAEAVFGVGLAVAVVMLHEQVKSFVQCGASTGVLAEVAVVPADEGERVGFPVGEAELFEQARGGDGVAERPMPVILYLPGMGEGTVDVRLAKRVVRVFSEAEGEAEMSQGFGRLPGVAAGLG